MGDKLQGIWFVDAESGCEVIVAILCFTFFVVCESCFSFFAVKKPSHELTLERTP